jgi:hypothetical protein
MDLLDLDLMQGLEKLTTTQEITTITFSKPFTPLKTNEQLRRYYAMLKCILTKLNVQPTAQNMKTLDKDTKERALPCEYLEIEGRKIPEPPISKAEMTVEQLNILMGWLESTYKYLKIDFASNDWYK